MLLSLRVSGVVLWFTGSLLELNYANPSHWAQPVLCVCAVGAFRAFLYSLSVQLANHQVITSCFILASEYGQRGFKMHSQKLKVTFLYTNPEVHLSNWACRYQPRKQKSLKLGLPKSVADVFDSSMLSVPGPKSLQQWCSRVGHWPL